MNVYSVWRFILEENEKLAKVRLATVHMVQVIFNPLIILLESL